MLTALRRPAARQIPAAESAKRLRRERRCIGVHFIRCPEGVISAFCPEVRSWAGTIQLTSSRLIWPILRKRRFITACVYIEFHARCIYRGGHGGGLKGVVLDS